MRMTQPSKRVWKTVESRGILKWILSGNPGARKLHHLFVLKINEDFKLYAPASLEWDFFYISNKTCWERADLLALVCGV